MKKKKIYEQPETVVTQVELESPICSGSANFTGDDKPGVQIEGQNVTTAGDNGVGGTLNDFGGSEWEVGN